MRKTAKAEGTKQPKANAQSEEAGKTGSVTITKDKAAEIFGKFNGIQFTPSPNGGSVMVNSKTFTWTWTSNRRIPTASGALYLIGQECEEFRKAYPNAKPAGGSGKSSRKGNPRKITSLAQLDSYTLQDLLALADVVQAGISRKQRVADIDRLIAEMQSMNAETLADLHAKRAELSTKANSGTAGDSEATPPSVESVASAVTEGNSKSDDQAGANPDQPEGAADTTA